MMYQIISLIIAIIVGIALFLNTGQNLGDVVCPIIIGFAFGFIGSRLDLETSERLQRKKDVQYIAKGML